MSFRLPKYRLHKGSGQALVQIDGTRFYLGKHGTLESKERYERAIAEYVASRRTPKSALPNPPVAVGITVNELILAFWHHARQRYVKHGEPTSEQNSFRTALRPVRHLYGRDSVSAFGPLALVACRQRLVEAGICRKRTNQHVTRIRQVFKWGVARELVPESVWRALCALQGLRFGEARETEPVRPVPEQHIEAIEPVVTPQIWAMVNLQLWSGCRPGEACVIRAIDIRMESQIWEFRPHTHKGEHHNKERVVYLGPHAQRIIKPWLRPSLYASLFSPREARAWYKEQRAKRRKTPVPPSQRRRRPKPNPLRWCRFDGHFECLGFVGEATSSGGSKYRCLFSSVPVWYHHR